MEYYIHTGLYSDLAYEMIVRADRCAWSYRSNGVEIERMPDDEVVFNCKQANDSSYYDHNHSYWNFAFDPTKTLGMKYYANVLKHIAKNLECKDFTRKSTSKVVFPSIERWNRLEERQEKFDEREVAVSDIVYIYDVLHGHKRARTNEASMVHVVGEPKDPIQANIEMLRRKKVAEIKEHYADLQDKEYDACESDIEAYRKKRNEESDKIVKQYKVDMENAIAELYKKLNVKEKML